MNKLRIALVVPHMFMHKEILPNAIFSPGYLALELAHGLQTLGHKITLFSPGPVETTVENITADLSLFEEELKLRGYGYLELLKKHPLLFATLARQVQSEIIAKVLEQENNFDVIHFYTNEEELNLVFAKFFSKPTLFNHHEPFNFLTKYRSSFPKYKHLNWISISNSQRKSMPVDSNFVATIYHGLNKEKFKTISNPSLDYFAFFGRIIEPKGVHLAIQAAKQAGVRLKIAGKHYTGFAKDKYWTEIIEPQIDGNQIEYVGFISDDEAKNKFLGNARALIIPSTWEEPFGMVMIESLACGTPIIGLDNGAITEVIQEGQTGFVVKTERNQILNARGEKRDVNDGKTVQNIANAIKKINNIDREFCRKDFEERFTLERMCSEYEGVYYKILN
jgi:glycosyltransferase involved in cell wall biosynthesis